MTHTVAASTIALSAYNVLARNKGPLPVSGLKAIVESGLNITISTHTFASCMAVLVEQGSINIVDESTGTIDVSDPNKNLVRSRDRTGSGWEKWTIHDEQGHHLLSEVLK